MTTRNRGLGADLLGTSRSHRTLQESEERGADVGTPMKNARYVPTDHVEPDPQQPRRQWNADNEKAQELIESVRAIGILHPINVTEAEGRPGYFVIVSGERRWQAARAAGLPQVPVIVGPPLSPDERLVHQLEENTQRVDLLPTETLEPLARILVTQGREWLRKHGWKHEARLSRWVAVAENRDLQVQLDDNPQNIGTLWELADLRGITAAYEMIVTRRQAKREEQGRPRMGRPAKAAGPASTPVVPGGSAAAPGTGPTPATGDYPVADEAGEDEPWDEDTVPGAPAGPRPAAPSSRSPARSAGGRSGAPAAPRPAASGAYGGGQDLGVISVDGSLYTVAAARDLIARIQDSPDLDVFDQLLQHGEYRRWIERAEAGDVQGWEADLQGLADWFEQRARTIRALIGTMPGSDDE